MLGCATGSAPAAAGAPPPLTIEALAPGVWVHRGTVDDWSPRNGGDVANLAAVAGDRCVAVIDTGGTPEVGERFRAAVASVTTRPVCFVINTHVHQDHLLGNSAFATAGPGGARPVVIGHAKLAASLAVRGRYMLGALQREFGLAPTPDWLVPPDETVADRRTLDLGGRLLQLRAWPTAHTDNDLSVFDERSGTLFLGDLLFEQHLPVIDGSLRGWIAVLDSLRAETGVRLVVPGHGVPSVDWPAALDRERQYLVAVRDATRAAIKSRIGLRDAVERIAPPSGDGWQLTEQFHRRNVTAAYAELEWED